MPNRTAKFVSAIFASILAGAPLTTVSHSAAGTADDCLSGPKGQTPQGGHWYYRIDRVTQRHCWYLGEEREKLSQTVPQNTSPSATPLPPEAGTAMQHSVANARAELPAQARVEPPNHNRELAPALSADTVRENNGGTGTPGAQTQRSVVATRWPDQSGADPSTNPPPNRRDPGTSANPTSPTQPTAVLAAGRFATANLSSETPTYSMQMQLAALMAVLALAGIMGSVIVKFGRSQRPRQDKIRKRRSPIWESTDDDRIVLSDHPATDVLSRRPRFSRGLDQAADPNHRIAEFFSQISGRAPT